MDFYSISFFVSLTNTQISKPAATTAISTSICPKCGTIEKSGKTSCCGRGGSWFKTCGSFGNSNLDHTWSEGIWACKTSAQSKTAIDQQLKHLATLTAATTTATHTTGIVVTYSEEDTTVSTDWITQSACFIHVLYLIYLYLIY